VKADTVAWLVARGFDEDKMNSCTLEYLYQQAAIIKPVQQLEVLYFDG